MRLNTRYLDPTAPPETGQAPAAILPPSSPAGFSTPAAPAANGHPDFGKQPAAPSDAPRPQPIWVSPDDWTNKERELQSLRTFKQESDAVAEAKENERVRLMAEKGQVEEAFKIERENSAKKIGLVNAEAQTYLKELLDDKRSVVITKALQGKTFVGADPQATAEMVRTLLERDVEAVRVDGKIVVRDRASMKPAEESIKERLESPAFSVFFQATTRGGSGADGARPAGAKTDNKDPNSLFAEQYKANLANAKMGRF